jgi:SAM-dependent methyltransferase
MIQRLLAKIIRQNCVVYNSTFFNEAYFQNWTELRPILANLIRTQSRWRAILDYGCGPGIMIDSMNDAGYYYVGYDRSVEARAMYASKFGKYPNLFVKDLSKVRLEDFDLLLAFDVLEHLTNQEVRMLLRTTHAIQEVFVNISRACWIPGHINIKSDRKWIKLFESEGLFLETEVTDYIRRRYRELRPSRPDIWHKNIFVFMRTDAQ